ncbi:hypothetical protein B7463_g9424, partial [Scytalidium lignicola]
MAKEGYPVRVQFIRNIAHAIKLHRNSVVPLSQPVEHDDTTAPRKNWTQSLRNRHDSLKTLWGVLLKGRVLNQHRYDNMDAWLDLIGPELEETKVLRGNSYNVIAAGFVLGSSDSIKDIVTREESRGSTNAKERRITVFECTSAEGVSLDPMIIWPAGTPQGNPKYNPAPSWHHTQSRSGYLDSTSLFKWIEKVFDPETKVRANGRPRRLIGDLFLDFNSLEIVQYCSTNKIQLCRLQLHPVHGLLEALEIEFHGKLGYRYHGRTEYSGKHGFSLFYKEARQTALAAPCVLSDWSRIEQAPIDRLQAIRTAETRIEVHQVPSTSKEVLTAQRHEVLDLPRTAEELMSLRKDIEDDETYGRLSVVAQVRIIQLAEAAEMAFAEVLTLQQHQMSE